MGCRKPKARRIPRGRLSDGSRGSLRLAPRSRWLLRWLPRFVQSLIGRSKERPLDEMTLHGRGDELVKAQRALGSWLRSHQTPGMQRQVLQESLRGLKGVTKALESHQTARLTQGQGWVVEGEVVVMATIVSFPLRRCETSSINDFAGILLPVHPFEQWLVG